MKRERKPVDPVPFSDPLKNYEPQDYADSIERALAEEEVGAITHQPVATGKPDEKVGDVLKRMVEMDVACILVLDEQERLLGVFSERDFLNKVSERYAEACEQTLAELMTPDPVVVHLNDPPGEALAVMSVGSFRHVPLVDVDEKLVGIVGPKRMSAYLSDLVERS